MIRIAVITCGDALADLALRDVFRSSDGEIVAVVRTRLALKERINIGRAALRSGALGYYCYMAAETLLPRLVIRHMPPSFLTVARERGIPNLETSDVNSEACRVFLGKVDADLILSIRPGQILRRGLIESQPAILNLHCATLPDYRGIGAVMQALAAGEEALGVSVHRIDSESLDRGDILAETRLRAIPGDSVFAHSMRLYKAAADVLNEAIRKTRVQETARSSEGGRYFSWPDRMALSRLHGKGHRMLRMRDLKPHPIPDR